MNQSNNQQIEEGLLLFKEEKYDAAYAAFEIASREDESLDLPFYYMAAIHTRRKEFDKALEYAQRAIDKNFNKGIKGKNMLNIILININDMEPKNIKSR